MSLLKLLGFALFAILLFHCVRRLPGKWQAFRRQEKGMALELCISALAIGFCLWGFASVAQSPY